MSERLQRRQQGEGVAGEGVAGAEAEAGEAAGTAASAAAAAAAAAAVDSAASFRLIFPVLLFVYLLTQITGARQLLEKGDRLSTDDAMRLVQVRDLLSDGDPANDNRTGT